MEHVWFHGNYPSWSEAQRDSTGYDAPAILAKVLAATRDVMEGRAAYERDSVTFAQVEYSFPLLVCLLYAATHTGNRLSVLDFGGSLGSSYRQNRLFLDHLEYLRWSVIEQPHFVHIAQTQIADSVLRFYESINECLAVETPDLALLSGVMPYLEDPYKPLRTLFSERLKFVVVDRTPFFSEDLPDRITVEEVAPSIYQGSYPAWFFNLRRFRNFVETTDYRIVHEFDSWERWTVDGDFAQSKCFLLACR